MYVHFPWCLEKCPYCDFVSYKAALPEVPHRAYADAVLAEIEARRPSFRERTVTSVFFGGGTPSLWHPGDLGRVLERLRCSFDVAHDLEVTVECNPTSLDEERARALVDVGVNRLSIGTQSLREDQLRWLGRLHAPEGALAAVRGAIAAGVPRVSTDLIFGLPGQPARDAQAQASALADLGLQHLSCYQLTIEPGTRFGELARRGRLPLAEEGAVADAFLAIDDALTARGFVHYEVSNYAMPGEESRHNLGYWRGLEYLGLGCGAYGFLRGDAGGVRYRDALDPRAYMESAGDAEQVTIACEPLDAETMLRERIMLGLRLASGFDLGEAAGQLGIADPWTARARTVDKLVARGRLVREGDTLRIPRAAWLFADDTAAHLF